MCPISPTLPLWPRQSLRSMYCAQPTVRPRTMLAKFSISRAAPNSFCAMATASASFPAQVCVRVAAATISTIGTSRHPSTAEKLQTPLGW